MHGHKLMQAIARVNRVFKNKPGGLVANYIGIVAELKNALPYLHRRERQAQPTVKAENALKVPEEMKRSASDRSRPCRDMHGVGKATLLPPKPRHEGCLKADICAELGRIRQDAATRTSPGRVAPTHCSRS